MTILVTGAAGFIGSNFVLDWFDNSQEEVVSIDILTYAGNLENLSSLDGNSPNSFFFTILIGRSSIKITIFSILCGKNRIK